VSAAPHQPAAGPAAARSQPAAGGAADRDGDRRSGLQAEIVASLALVMLLATALLAAVLAASHEARLRDLLGRALLAEAQAREPGLALAVPDTDWWRIGAGGAATPLRVLGGPIDGETRALAERARMERRPLLRPGAVWESIRFATPLDAQGTVAAARLPRAASFSRRLAPLGVAVGVLCADVAIFTAFGVYLLRRRVVQPLDALARATTSLARGDPAVRVPVQGPRETAELARAFNEMSDALARRTGALVDAVRELRAANTDLRRARAGLDRAERLAAVGRLAAGVSHEVGNPIAALLAFLDLVGRDPGLGPASREHLARAAQQGERVRRILGQLLDFSKPARGVPAWVDLAEAGRETLDLVRAQRRYAGVSFRVVAEPGAPRAWADPGAVGQILLNLVLNAADAVGEGGSPRVELRVRGTALVPRAGEGVGAAHARRTPDAVECLVCDAGPGIAEEDRERIFDPFFTTKPPGRGTGLGLANSLRLAEEQGGALELGAAPEGLRTAFVLRLPCTAPEPATGHGVALPALRSDLRDAQPVAGSETLPPPEVRAKRQA
jgi:signal transduction histidine kinase